MHVCLAFERAAVVEQDAADMESPTKERRLLEEIQTKQSSAMRQSEHGESGEPEGEGKVRGSSNQSEVPETSMMIPKPSAPMSRPVFGQGWMAVLRVLYSRTPPTISPNTALLLNTCQRKGWLF